MQIEIRRDEIVGRNDEGNILADLYLPSNRTKSVPVIIFIHGGAFKLGSKEMYADWGPYLAEHGYAIMAVDYRLATPTKSTWPGALEDMEQALIWLTKHAAELKIDMNRIGVSGDSVGAYFATMLALKSKENNLGNVRCLIGVYGVYDLNQWWEYTQKVRHDDPVGIFIGGSPEEKPELYQEASPTYQWQKMIKAKQTVDIQSFIVWGNKDEVVEPIQSLDFIQFLEGMGSEHETLEIPDAGHFWFTILPDRPGGRIEDQPNNSLAPRILNFLEKHI